MSTDYPRHDATGRPVSDAEYDSTTAPVYAYETPRHDDVIAREKARFGGMKFGSAFFGWLTAIGTVVLLTAVVTAIGAALGIGTGTTVEEAADAAAGDPATFSIIGAVAIAVVLFVAYLAGGYVAGRMARFSGALQGLAVWLWGIIIAIVVAVVSLIAGQPVGHPRDSRWLPAHSGDGRDRDDHRHPDRRRGGSHHARRRGARRDRGHALPPHGGPGRARRTTPSPRRTSRRRGRSPHEEGNDMGIGDDIKHNTEKTVGKVKEGIGDATDNERLEAEGQADQAKANVKKVGDDVKDVFTDK